jgi:hypothetical protein
MILTINGKQAELKKESSIEYVSENRIFTDGKVDLVKLKPIVFDAAGMCYRAVGDSVGQAWGSGKKFQ